MQLQCQAVRRACREMGKTSASESFSLRTSARAERAPEVSQCVTCGSGGGNLRQRRGEKGLVGHGVIGGGGAAAAENEGPRGTVRGRRARQSAEEYPLQ
jgi:hypothetical protein